MKLTIGDYVGELTQRANFGFNRCFSPNRWNVTTLTFLTVLSCPYLFLNPAPRSNRWTDFHTLWLKQCVSSQGWSFWGLERWVTIFGENMPQNPLKWAQIGNFKPKWQNIKIAILVSPKLQIGSRPNLRTKLRPTIALRGWSNIIFELDMGTICVH